MDYSPLYIVSKSRWQSRLTVRALEAMRAEYHVIVEEQERADYASVIDPKRLLVLDPEYQRKYETCDDLGDSKSKGPGPARNFAWDHAIARGKSHHWVMDDNIRGFFRLVRNEKIPCSTPQMFVIMEAFVARYSNVLMAGPNYDFFAKRKQLIPPFIANTRIYSCNLIRNDIPFRWRGRYNEDTDLSLCILKAGGCTVQFNAFLQRKMRTQTMKGGCNKEFYQREGTVPKSRMLVEMHPDVAHMVWKFDRWHHHVDYRPFRANKLQLKPDVVIPKESDEFGLKRVSINAR